MKNNKEKMKNKKKKINSHSNRIKIEIKNRNKKSYKDSPCAIATIPGMSLTSNSEKASIPSSS